MPTKGQPEDDDWDNGGSGEGVGGYGGRGDWHI